MVEYGIVVSVVLSEYVKEFLLKLLIRVVQQIRTLIVVIAAFLRRMGWFWGCLLLCNGIRKDKSEDQKMDEVHMMLVIKFK